MKIRVLVDNNTLIDRYFVGEPAVCYYIEMDGMRILFDTGYSDVFLKNAGAMGMDMKDITHIVLSHGHNDHTGGLSHVCADCMGIHHPRPDIRLVAHPGCFEPKVCDGEDIGSPWGRNVAETCFSYIPAVKPWFLSENCVFLGQIPRENGFEGRDAIGVRKPWDGGCGDAGGQGKQCVNAQTDDSWQQDTLEDDSALVCKAEHGLFIITGCSHSGICNIVDYAVKVCGESRIVGILGGFHLFDVDNRLEQTIRYLERMGVKTLYPCHCVSLKAKIKMAETLNVSEVGVGMEIMAQDRMC